MRILIIGAGGLLGSVLREGWKGNEVIGARSKDADIRDRAQLAVLFDRARPDWTIVAAAYTDVDGCERDPETAFQVNHLGAKNAAEIARQHGSKLLLISTDYVFDGSADSPYEPHSPVHPINAYGRSKAEGERAVQEGLREWCIVRTSWLFGAGGKCFPDTILRLAESGKELAVVSDQIGSPTYNRDLAAAIRKLVEANARGIFHAVNTGVCSWHEFARAILAESGMESVSVKPISTTEAGRLAPRPPYSVLSNAKLHALGIPMRPWRAALHDYVEVRRGSRLPVEEAERKPEGSPARVGEAGKEAQS